MYVLCIITHTKIARFSKWEEISVGDIVYIRLKKKITINQNKLIRLKDIAHITGNETLIHSLKETAIYKITDADKNLSVIDGFIVINQLIKIFPNVEFQLIGTNQTIISIQKSKKKISVLFVAVIWLLLFIGSAMAIVNFHYDVSMREVQQKLHFMLTGHDTAYPLWMQVPYSIGLGIGMILFFNHIFKKRFNEEPSPLEIEVFKYQQDLDNYVTTKENIINADEKQHE